MANQHSLNIAAHHNIYNMSSGREVRIDFSAPEEGVNSDTGLLLLVPGFGGNIDSNVYKKMRDTFSDKYNLVTLQCSFFGDEFMQGAAGVTLKGIDKLIDDLNVEEKGIIKQDSAKLLSILSTKVDVLLATANIDETEDNFNDMGFMQAIDLITAVEAVQLILKDNELKFNENKIIGYGHSHGAYLLHLSNRLAPHLFSHIIDNSAWVEPVYLSSNRYLTQKYGEAILQIEFDYIAKELIKNKESLNLESIYQHFYNKAEIITFQGTEDNLIDYKLKEKITYSIANTTFHLICEERVDQKIFKSNKHGLDADFLEMFSWAYQQFEDVIDKHQKKEKYDVQIARAKINVDYSQGLPLFAYQEDYYKK